MTKQRGFTIVELLIVIIVIAILAAIVIITYSGIQANAQQSKMRADLEQVQKLVEDYAVINGAYPVTASNLNPNYGTTTAKTDSNCSVGSRSTNWVPGLGTTLPQSSTSGQGVGGYPGCYIYASDGTSYIISAWNMVASPQTTLPFYRRLGFREMDPSHSGTIFYLCNFSGTIGGVNSGVYNIALDYYKHSYTLSNVNSSTCNETPPSGA